MNTFFILIGSVCVYMMMKTIIGAKATAGITLGLFISYILFFS